MIDGSTLVLVGAHILSIHTCEVQDLVTHTEVEVGHELPVSVEQLDAETTIDFRIRAAEIDDIEFVNLSVVVDVFIHDVTALELIVDTAVVVHHRQRVAVLVIYYISFCIVNDRSSLSRVLRSIAICSVRIYNGLVGIEVLVLFVVEEEAVVVVVVSVDTLVAESVDTTERVTNLEAAQHTLVRIVEVGVVACQYGSIHIRNGVDVLREVGIQTYAELLASDRDAHEVLRVDVDFPTFVLHRADVRHGKALVTCG